MTTTDETRERIYVDAGDVPILIAAAKTGIFYTNQTGGVACNHPAIEGFAVPLGPGLEIDACCFGKHFGDVIPEDVAARVEAQVRLHLRWSDVRDFTIDRSRDDHDEAWIWCSWSMEINEAGERRNFYGVLTYENCD